MAIARVGLQFLEPFFSSREFDLIQTLLLSPLRQDNNLHAVLLISIEQHEIDGYDPETIRRVVESIQVPVYENRAKRLAALPPLDIKADKSLSDQVQAEVSAADKEQSRLLCASISLLPLVEAFTVSEVVVDALRFREDFLQVLHSFVDAAGSIIRVSNSQVLICLRTRQATDPKFVIQHVCAALADFYASIPNVPGFVEDAVYYPDQAVNTKAICERLRIPLANA